MLLRFCTVSISKTRMISSKSNVAKLFRHIWIFFVFIIQVSHGIYLSLLFPLEFKCEEDHMSCYNETKCISRMWVCDGDYDCKDHSDELNCCKFNVNNNHLHHHPYLHLFCKTSIQQKSHLFCFKMGNCIMYLLSN